MKKNIYLVAAIAVASVLFEGCQKWEMVTFKAEGKVFSASIEQGFTKTTLSSDFKTYWEATDKIYINTTLYAATPKTPATKADFVKESGSDPIPTYKAIYPASILDWENGMYTFPSTQTYNSGKLNAPMYAESNTQNLSFKNICGILDFALKGTAKVKSITVSAFEAICGAFVVTSDGTVTLYSNSNTVTLDCGTGVNLNTGTATHFYISVPPGTYSAGLTVTVKDSDGKTFVKTTTAGVTIARNNLYTFNWTPTFSTPLPPVGALSGEFSVSPTKKVHFSKGNLWSDASVSPQLWSFETNQFDSPLTDGPYSNSHVFHFYWETTGNYGSQASCNTSSGEDWDIVDWGTIYCSSNSLPAGTWRTLSETEWKYLLETRGKGDLFFNTCVSVCGISNCLVIAPDGNSTTIKSSYDATAWAAAEAAGFICLPPTGWRYGTVSGTGTYGMYWTATCNGKDKAHNMYFYDKYFGLDKDYRNTGFSVRLVNDSI